MTWIRLDTDFTDHELIGTLAEALRIDPDRAAMTLIRVWGRLADFQPDGNLSRISDTTLEDWARWRGKRGGLAGVFRATCVDPTSGQVRGWWRQEKLLQHQIEKRGRRRAADRTEDRQETGAAILPDSRPEIAYNSNGNVNRTTTAAAAAAGPDRAELIGRLTGDPNRHDAAAFLEALPPDQPEYTWLRLLIACLDGVGMPSGQRATTAALLTACRDFPAVAGLRWSPRHFRACVAGAMREATKRAVGSGPAQGLGKIERARSEFLEAAG